MVSKAEGSPGLLELDDGCWEVLFFYRFNCNIICFFKQIGTHIKACIKTESNTNKQSSKEKKQANKQTNNAYSPKGLHTYIRFKGFYCELRIQEFWDHAVAHKWEIDALWKHVWLLSTKWVTTKHSMEDLIGSVSDHTARDQKREHQSMERMFFFLANSRRLNTTDFQFLRFERGDLANDNLKKGLSRKETFVSHSERSNLAQGVKEALLLQSRGYQADPSDFAGQAFQPTGKNLWKPGGQPADNREIASMMALRHTEREDFKSLHRCWASFLLQEGQGGSWCSVRILWVQEQCCLGFRSWPSG